MLWTGVGAYHLDLWLNDFDRRGSLAPEVITQLQEDPDLRGAPPVTDPHGGGVAQDVRGRRTGENE